jgi:hypothetical protein
LRMLASPHNYRSYLLLSHRQLWSKLFRLSRRKIRDYILMRRKGLTSDQKQQQLMNFYLQDPDYQKWLDGLTDKIWF